MSDDWSALGSVVRPRQQAPASDWSALGTVVDPLDRSMGERFQDNVGEGARRSAAGAVLRSADPAADGLFRANDLLSVQSGSPLDWVLDRTLGQNRSFAPDSGERYDPLGTIQRTLTGQSLRGTAQAQQEDARRNRFDARAAIDPVSNAGDAAASFSGQLVGAAPSPENWIGGGSGRGLSLVPRLAARAGEQAFVAGGTDAALQVGDIQSGIEDRFSPTQTAFSAVIGGTLGPAFEVGVPLAGRAIGDSASRIAGDWSALGQEVRGALDEGSLPRFDGAAMDAGPVSTPYARTPAPVRTPDGQRASDWARDPQIRVVGEAPPSAMSRPSQPAPVSFVAPVNGPVSSGYGPRTRPNARASADHKGIDYAIPEGSPVASAAPGVVIFAGTRGNYGNRVVVRHADGSESSYSHLSRFDVREGDQVEAGQVVARSGSTGNVTGPHLHFEVRQGGAFVDPRLILNGEAPAFTGGFDAPARATIGEAVELSRPAEAQRAPEMPRESPALGSEGLGLADTALGVRAAENGPSVDPRSQAPYQPLAQFDAAGRPIDPANAAARAADAAPVARLGADEPFPVIGRQDFDAQGRPLDPVARGEDWSALGERVSGQADEWASLGSVVRRADDAAPVGDWAALGPVVQPSGKLAVDLSSYGDRIGQPLPSSGQSVGGLRDAPRPGAVARGQGVEFAGKTVSDLAADLRSTLGITSRQGRVGMRGALGTYDRGSGVVRTKAVDELDVLAHEATHALEFEQAGPSLLAAMKRHAKELKALDYDPTKARRHEGFAEFGRWYLTNPDHARRVAPGFYDAFEQALGADAPQVLSGMKAIQDGYRNLLSSASLDVARASLAYTGDKGPIRNLVDEVARRGPGSVVRRLTDKLYTAVIDDLHPLSVAERELSALYLKNKGVALDLKRAASPYAIARLTREVYAAGHNDLMRGVTPYHGIDPEGPSLADALETANLPKDRLGEYSDRGREEFDAYLISRRALGLWDRYAAGDLPNPPDRNTRQFHEQVIADAEAANPTWPDAAKVAYEFQNNLWRKKFEAGLITKESYDNGLTHADYVPWQRDMSDKGPGGKAGRPRGALQFAGGVNALEGSTRDIISPLSSIMREAYALNALIRKNDALKALDDLAQKAGPGAGEFVERLPARQIEAVNIDAEQALRRTAEEMGLTGRDLSTLQQLADDAAANETTLTLFKPSEFSPRKGEAVVFVWRDGKKTPLLLADGEFGQEMFRALTGLNQYLRNVVVDTMAAGTQLLRYGVTLSPEFIGANLVRDAIATWINTDVGFVPGLDTITGGAKVLKGGMTANRYATAGGMRGGANVAATAKPFPQTDAEAQAQLRHLQTKGFRIRQLSWRKLAEATDLSETSTRMGVFERAFNKAKAEGLSDYEALIESGFTSRDYLDFGRRGSKMVTASRLVTFLNAALQGLDKTTRVLSAGGDLKAVLSPDLKGARTPAKQAAVNHARKAWLKVAMLGAVGLGLRTLYADDPEYQEINDRLRATHWVFRSGGSWVFIPKPFELATISNILERGFEGTVLNDPTAGERLLSDFRHTIAPPSEIPALSVPFNIARNRDYLGRPIVPDHLLGMVDPEMQFNSFTSDLGKLIGRTFNVSPAQADYVITGLGGSIGRYVQQGSNLIGEAVTGRPRTAAGPEDAFLARRFIRQIDRGSESQAEFWDEVSRDGGNMVRAEGSFRALMRDGKDAEATTYLNRLSPGERAYVVNKVFGPEGSGRDHPLGRVQGVLSVLSDFRGSLRDGSLRDDAGQVIPLSPTERRTLDNAIADFAMAEMRNALIQTGVRGWQQKEPIDPMPSAERIGQTSPAVAVALQTWLGQSKAATVFHPDQLAASQMRWQQAAPSYMAPVDPDFLIGRMRQERLTEGDRRGRYEETLRQRGGAYAPTTGMMTAPRQTPAPQGPRMMTQ